MPGPSGTNVETLRRVFALPNLEVMPSRGQASVTQSDGIREWAMTVPVRWPDGESSITLAVLEEAPSECEDSRVSFHASTFRWVLRRLPSLKPPPLTPDGIVDRNGHLRGNPLASDSETCLEKALDRQWCSVSWKTASKSVASFEALLAPVLAATGIARPELMSRIKRGSRQHTFSRMLYAGEGRLAATDWRRMIRTWDGPHFAGDASALLPSFTLQRFVAAHDLLIPKRKKRDRNPPLEITAAHKADGSVDAMRIQSPVMQAIIETAPIPLTDYPPLDNWTDEGLTGLTGSLRTIAVITPVNLRPTADFFAARQPSNVEVLLKFSATPDGLATIEPKAHINLADRTIKLSSEGEEPQRLPLAIAPLKPFQFGIRASHLQDAANACSYGSLIRIAAERFQPDGTVDSVLVFHSYDGVSEQLWQAREACYIAPAPLRLPD